MGASALIGGAGKLGLGTAIGTAVLPGVGTILGPALDTGLGMIGGGDELPPEVEYELASLARKSKSLKHRRKATKQVYYEASGRVQGEERAGAGKMLIIGGLAAFVVALLAFN